MVRDGNTSPPKKRSRLTVACDTCRSRKQKCDGARPRCSYCQQHRDVRCVYQQAAESQSTKLEKDIAAIKQQLESVSTAVNEVVSISRARERQDHANNHDTGRSIAATGDGQDEEILFPFLDLKTPESMTRFELRPDLSRRLAELERENVMHAQLASPPRFMMIQHERALSALSAFSVEVHGWYPILPTNYTNQFQHQISGDLAPSSKTCLALLICAIGSLFTTGVASGSSFVSMAMASLASVMFDNSVESIQSLIMLSVYNSCLYRPCQAHEFAMAASYKVQSLLKECRDEDSTEEAELLRRAYWAVLLIENELNVQFELPQSGLWALDEQVPLPTMRTAWHFSAATSGATLNSPYEKSSPNVLHTSATSPDRINCYFLAAIAMRRMLHRCTTAIRPTGSRDGQTNYSFAPIIARELEAQLDEWYTYLPQAVRFDKDDNLTTTPGDFDYRSDEPLQKFLHVQYDCCRASIYWPAVWDAIKSGHAGTELLFYCQKFFRSYMYILPNISSLVSKCRVNAWTMYATVFVMTLAAAESMKSHCLQATIPHNLVDVVLSAPQVFEAVKDISPSLALLQDLLDHRIKALINTMSPVTGVYA